MSDPVGGETKVDPRSDRWRHGGFMVNVTTLLDEGDELQPAIDYVTSWLAEKGYDAEVMWQGERPAFTWEVPSAAESPRG